MLQSRLGSALFVLALALVITATAFTEAQQPKLPPIVPAQAKLEHTFKGLDGPGVAIAASKKAIMVAAACDHNTIQLWRKDALLGVRDGSNSADVLKAHVGPVLDLAWSGDVLASTGADKKIMLWGMPHAKLLQTLEAAFLVRTLALSPDGKVLASGGDSNDIQLWNVETGKTAKELKGHKDWVMCLNFSEDGKQLLSGGYEGKALLWDAITGNKVRELPEPPKDQKTPPDLIPVTKVLFSADGKQAFLGLADGNIDHVNLADGKKIRALTGHTSTVTGLAFHPSGTLLVSSSRDGSIRLWNPANGTLIKELKDHTAWVEGVVFIADGTRLVSVSADQTVRVWNLTQP